MDYADFKYFNKGAAFPPSPKELGFHAVKKMKEGGLGILEALENLNTIVEVDSLADIEVTSDDRMISHKEEEELGEVERTEYWLQAGGDKQTVHAIKETFRSVNRYLRSFYAQMKRAGDNKRLVHGINNIMVLVGEAAKKLDDYSSLFKERIYDFKEYQDLQEFYRDKIVKESYDDFAKEAHPLPEEEVSTLTEEKKKLYLLNDIEVIKNDTDYELFYIKREDGSHFFTFELGRIIQLATDFAEFNQTYFSDDPLIQIKNWEDKSLQIFAKRLLHVSKHAIARFYRQMMNYRERESAALLNKAIMALMLAANPKNLLRQFAKKGCYLYFDNFIHYFRELFSSRDFQKLLLYSPESDPFLTDMLRVIESLSLALFTQGRGEKEIKQALVHLTQMKKEKKGEKNLSQFLTSHYEGLEKVLKHHPHGPLFKAVDLVREIEEERVFDPFLLGNVPTPAAVIKMGEKEKEVIVLPSPTSQERIDKAKVVEELKIYLQTIGHEKHGRLLLFDFQDRTSWKEYARAKAIEELSQRAEYTAVLFVATLANQTDFYFQRGEYADLEESEQFIEVFAQLLADEGTGYYFSQELREVLFPRFVPALLSKIHASFFEGKKRLTLKDRECFIDMAYLLIELKAIEACDPLTIGFVSKDGLDEASVRGVSFLSLLVSHQQTKLREEELEHLNYLLLGSTLLLRERAPRKNVFARFAQVLKLIESKITPKGLLLEPFADLFDSKTLAAKVHFPTIRD